jgi:hypothetical protein
MPASAVPTDEALSYSLNSPRTDKETVKMESVGRLIRK